METVDWDGLMEKVRPMLPAGAVVVSPETVAEIKQLKGAAQYEADLFSEWAAGEFTAYERVLCLLGVKEEK